MTLLHVKKASAPLTSTLPQVGYGTRPAPAAPEEKADEAKPSDVAAAAAVVSAGVLAWGAYRLAKRYFTDVEDPPVVAAKDATVAVGVHDILAVEFHLDAPEADLWERAERDRAGFDAAIEAAVRPALPEQLGVAILIAEGSLRVRLIAAWKRGWNLDGSRAPRPDVPPVEVDAGELEGAVVRAVTTFARVAKPVAVVGKPVLKLVSFSVGLINGVVQLCETLGWAPPGSAAATDAARRVVGSIVKPPLFRQFEG